MPDTITIKGVRPYDGVYDVDTLEQEITNREWSWIKKYAGYLPATMGNNWLADPEFQMVYALIALHRHGVIEPRQAQTVIDRFLDVPPFSSIRIEFAVPDEEDDAGPPPLSSSSNGSSSGDDSTTSSETSEPHPSRTGHPPSDTSVSVPVTSAT